MVTQRRAGGTLWCLCYDSIDISLLSLLNLLCFKSSRLIFSLFSLEPFPKSHPDHFVQDSHRRQEGGLTGTLQPDDLDFRIILPLLDQVIWGELLSADEPQLLQWKTCEGSSRDLAGLL